MPWKICGDEIIWFQHTLPKDWDSQNIAHVATTCTWEKRLHATWFTLSQLPPNMKTVEGNLFGWFVYMRLVQEISIPTHSSLLYSIMYICTLISYLCVCVCLNTHKHKQTHSCWSPWLQMCQYPHAISGPKFGTPFQTSNPSTTLWMHKTRRTMISFIFHFYI